MLEPGTYILRLSSWKQFLAGYDKNGRPVNKACCQAKPYRSWSLRVYGFNVTVNLFKFNTKCCFLWDEEILSVRIHILWSGIVWRFFLSFLCKLNTNLIFDFYNDSFFSPWSTTHPSAKCAKIFEILSCLHIRSDLAHPILIKMYSYHLLCIKIHNFLQYIY